MTVALTEDQTGLTPDEERQLVEAFGALAHELEIMQESFADLEQLHAEDQGWARMGFAADMTFTRQGLRDAAKRARFMLIANPLLKRGVALRTAYVWARGVQIQARATGSNTANPLEQDVNTVVQAFLDNPDTRKVLTGASARERNDRTLATDGTLHVALVTNPLTGDVRPRIVPNDEIDDVITSGQDRIDRWFYVRSWTQVVTEPLYGGGFRKRSEVRKVLYPALDYKPATRPAAVAGIPVAWDSPVAEVNVNDLEGWDFGIGDLYASIPWAKAYSEFLTDWARLVKALSRFAFRATADKTGKARQAAASQRAVDARSVVDGTGIPGPRSSNAGGTVHLGPGQNLEAIPKTGATIDSESGKPLAAMIASGLEVPVTMLLTDPGVSGARATAETLDTPTENMANLRREVWAEFYTRILGHVIDASAKAPQGSLRRKSLTRDKITGRETITLAGDTDRTIEIVWPDLTETSLKDLVDAIVAADDTGKMPEIETMKLLLNAFNIRDMDELIEKATDADGNWIDRAMSAGQAAAEAFRRGEDPASTLA